MSKLLELETTAGSFIINPNDEIFTYLGPEDYFRKLGRDINIGDMVPVDGITTTLEQIEPLLMQDARYRSSHEEIFLRNKLGEAVPKMRVLLLQNLCNQPGLEAKVWMEDDDFTREELSPFVDRIFQLEPTSFRNGSTRLMQRESLFNWFTNPGLQDWDNFARLAHLNPEFKHIYESHGNGEGFHASYTLYTDVRAEVQSHIARRKPHRMKISLQDAPSLTPKQETVRRIVQKVFAVYNEHLTAAAVMGMRKVKGENLVRESPIQREKGRPNIIVGKPKGFEYKPNDVTYAINHEAIYKECLWSLLYDYADLAFGKSGLFKDPIKAFEQHTPFVLRVAEKMLKMPILERKLLYERHPLARRHFPALYTTGPILDDAIGKFHRGLHTGESESLLGVPRYAASDLADALNRSRSIIPATYFRWEKATYDIAVLTSLLHPNAMVSCGPFFSLSVSDETIPAHEQAQLREEIKLLAKDAHAMWAYLGREYQLGEKKHFEHEYVPLSIRNPLTRMEMRNAKLQDGVVFFVRSDIKDALQRIDLLSLLPYYDAKPNFV